MVSKVNSNGPDDEGETTMPERLRMVLVPPESDLAQALKAATDADGSFIADTGIARYRVSVRRADAPSVDQVAGTLAGIRRAAGAWAHQDADALKAAVRARRRSGSLPSPRW